MTEFNFLINDSPGDIELFFGPVNPEVDSFHQFEAHHTMAHVLFTAGVFPSVSQARNNGWNKPIPSGFTDMRAGKLKTRISILKVG